MAWTTSPLAEKPALIGHNEPPIYTDDEKNDAILSWREAKRELDVAKELEMTKRETLAKMLFPNPVKGTQRYNLGEGYAVKLVHKYNYKLDPDKVQDALDKIEAQGPVGQLIVDRLVKFVPTLSQTEYKQLGQVDKRIIDEMLTITDAAPSLELEEPKAK